MAILNIDLTNINLDDTNYEEDDPNTIILIRLLDWHNKFERRKFEWPPLPVFPL